MSGPSRDVDEAWINEPIGWDDPLTGLEGPSFWQRVAIAELARSAKYGRPLSVVVVEVEGLTRLADLWGEEIARHALREVAQCLRRLSRKSDYCTRIGLTRFGVVLTETDEIAAINFVERVREDCPRSLPRGAQRLRLSFGWASPRPDESPESLVRRAEARLLAELLP